MATATSPARRGAMGSPICPRPDWPWRSRLHLGRAVGLVSRGCDRRQEGRRLADDETPGRDIVSRRGAPGGPCGPGLRRPPERGPTDTAAAHPNARSPGAPPDRLRERPRTLALSPALLPPGRLRCGPSRRRRVRGAAANPVRVLGPRGVASARGASPAPALAHGAGRAGPRPLSETGPARSPSPRLRRRNPRRGGRARPPDRVRAEQRGAGPRLVVGLERGQDRPGVALLERPGDDGDAPSFRARLRSDRPRARPRGPLCAHAARGRGPAVPGAAGHPRARGGDGARCARLLPPRRRRYEASPGRAGRGRRADPRASRGVEGSPPTCTHPRASRAASTPGPCSRPSTRWSSSGSAPSASSDFATESRSTRRPPGERMATTSSRSCWETGWRPASISRRTAPRACCASRPLTRKPGPIGAASRPRSSRSCAPWQRGSAWSASRPPRAGGSFGRGATRCSPAAPGSRRSGEERANGLEDIRLRRGFSCTVRHVSPPGRNAALTRPTRRCAGRRDTPRRSGYRPNRRSTSASRLKPKC